MFFVPLTALDMLVTRTIFNIADRTPMAHSQHQIERNVGVQSPDVSDEVRVRAQHPCWYIKALYAGLHSPFSSSSGAPFVVRGTSASTLYRDTHLVDDLED